MSENLPVYKIIDGVRVRKDGDLRDPTRRYSHVVDANGNQSICEFTDAEEQETNEREAAWKADAPQRELDEKRLQFEGETYRDALRYETRFVAFVDILGWTSAIKSSHTDHDRTRQLGIALTAIRKQTQQIEGMRNLMATHGDGHQWPGDPQATHFSDCLVISTRADRHGREQLISTLSSLCVNLLHQGFLLRGGVTKGDVYHQDGMVFGPAFLTAYELESRVAIYPRIILDPNLTREWGQGVVIVDKNNVLLDQAKTWRLSDDGFRFFDFLQPFGGFPGFQDSPHLIQSTLEPLRLILVKALDTYRENLSVWPKYVWLANYFNNVCAEHLGHGVALINIDRKEG